MAEPRPASTVVLVRDGDEGIEAWVMRRVTSMAFAPTMHVFPGGRVDPRDYDIAVSFVGPTEERDRLAERASASDAELGALYACAVRETEEESGVRLAETAADAGLVIDPILLPIIDHWITPEIEPRRYDVRFFAALLPVGQEARLTSTEADDAYWIAADVAVARFAAGEMDMLPPTISMLEYLAGFTDCASMLVDASARRVVPLMPTVTIDEDGVMHWSLDRSGDA